MTALLARNNGNIVTLDQYSDNPEGGEFFQRVVFPRPDLQAALPYLLGGFAGGLLSGKLYTRLPVTLLRRVFGAVLIFGGVRAVVL